jgi:hypothetical protein
MEDRASGYGPYLFIVIDVSEIGVDIGWLFDRLAVSRGETLYSKDFPYSWIDQDFEERQRKYVGAKLGLLNRWMGIRGGLKRKWTSLFGG